MKINFVLQTFISKVQTNQQFYVTSQKSSFGPLQKETNFYFGNTKLNVSDKLFFFYCQNLLILFGVVAATLSLKSIMEQSMIEKLHGACLPSPPTGCHGER